MCVYVSSYLYHLYHRLPCLCPCSSSSLMTLHLFYTINNREDKHCLSLALNSPWTEHLRRNNRLLYTRAHKINIFLTSNSLGSALSNLTLLSPAFVSVLLSTAASCSRRGRERSGRWNYWTHPPALRWQGSWRASIWLGGDTDTDGMLKENLRYSYTLNYPSRSVHSMSARITLFLGEDSLHKPFNCASDCRYFPEYLLTAPRDCAWTCCLYKWVQAMVSTRGWYFSCGKKYNTNQ